MNKSRIIVAVALLGISATFASCKKDFVCTCNTVVGAGSVEIKHNIDNANRYDAQKSCNNYEDQANSTLPGGTTCHL
jgi:predicted small secreted protein